MPCVSASNSVEISRTNSSYSWAVVENRRMDHHKNNTTTIRGLPKECKCSLLERITIQTNSKRILRFRHRALLILFVLLNIYAMAPAAPSRRGYNGRYCGTDLADALAAVCSRRSRATQHVRGMLFARYARCNTCWLFDQHF